MLTLWEKSTVKIPWFINESGDQYFACVGGYTLNVFRIKQRLFRWHVSLRGEVIQTKLKDTTGSRNRAIGLAEGLYACHSLQDNRYREIVILQSKINQDNENRGFE